MVKKNIIEIDFYHVDAFEVTIFFPIYKELLKLGILPRPVIPDEKFRTSTDKYLDIEECKNFYRKNDVKFYSNSKYNNIVCSTQGSEFLAPYRNLKIRLPYGLGVYPKGWGLNRKATLGYDQILVHGEVYKKYLSQFFPINKLHISGFPRYDRYFLKHLDTSEINNKINLDTSKMNLLILPSWQNDNFLEESKLIASELGEYYNIVIKPHHLTFLKNTKLIEEIKNINNVYVVKEGHLLDQLFFISHVVLSDIKSCAYTESLMLDKKTIGYNFTSKDLDWISNNNLTKYSYVCSKNKEIVDSCIKYIHEDPFNETRKEFSIGRVHFLNGSGSNQTAKILVKIVNENFIFKTYLNPKNILKIPLYILVAMGILSPNKAMGIISRIHWLLLKYFFKEI